MALDTSLDTIDDESTASLAEKLRKKRAQEQAEQAAAPSAEVADTSSDPLNEAQSDSTDEPSAASAAPVLAPGRTVSTTRTISQSLRKGPGNEAPSKDESRKLFDDLRTKLDEYKANTPAFPGRNAQTDSLRQEALDAYKSQASRNEWLDIAQRVGRALAQAGAAASGLAHNRDNSQINMGEPVDYSRKTDQAYREYRDRLGDVAGQENAEQEKYRAEESNRRFGLGEEMGLGKARLSELEARMRASAQENAANNRLSITEKNAQDREGASDRRLQVQDLQNQKKEAQKQLESAGSLASILANQGDFSSKSMKKLEEQTPGIMGRAGISPDELQQIERDATEKGMIWDSVNKETRAKLIKERILDKKKEDIRNLQQSIDSLIHNRKQQSESTLPANNAAAPAPQESGMVTMRAPNGKTGQVPADKVRDAEAKGFTRVQ